METENSQNLPVEKNEARTLAKGMGIKHLLILNGRNKLAKESPD